MDLVHLRSGLLEFHHDKVARPAGAAIESKLNSRLGRLQTEILGLE